MRCSRQRGVLSSTESHSHAELPQSTTNGLHSIRHRTVNVIHTRAMRFGDVTGHSSPFARPRTVLLTGKSGQTSTLRFATELTINCRRITLHYRHRLGYLSPPCGPCKMFQIQCGTFPPSLPLTAALSPTQISISHLFLLTSV